MKKYILIALISFLLTACATNSGTNNNNDSNGGQIIGENSNNSDNQNEEPKNKTLTLTRNLSKVFEGDDYKVELTYIDSWKTDEVRPPEPRQSYYTYYQKTEGNKYIVTSFTVKNLDGDGISDYMFENFLGDYCSAEVKAGGTYNYGGFFLEAEKDSDGKHDLTTLIYIDPLQTATLYFVSSLPNEAANMPLKINICLNEDTLNFE